MTMDLPRPRVLKTNPEVAAYYGSGLPNFLRAEAKKIRAFGDPTKSDWKDKNIIPVKLEGFGPDLSQTRSIDFHKFLAKRLQKVFQEILAENRASSKPYILKGNFSGGYLFRYKTEMIDDKWRNDPFYAEPLRNLKQGEDIRIAFAEWDRKQGTFHLPAPRTKDRAIRSTLLSDHAYGSAIDLNYTDNNMVKGNTSTADMPRRIVEIFEANGFRWGGFYQQTNHDYMHFEWGLLRPPIGGGAARNFFFPLELGEGQNPGTYYANNETCAMPGKEGGSPQTEGGFFPLSMPHEQKLYLHGGVHLSPEGKATSVHNLAPGYIVAARMAPKEHDSCSETSSAAICNWTNFVLVRHDLEKPKGTLFSLYMHMKPVETPFQTGSIATDPQPLKGDLADIPWLRQVFLGQHGMFIKVRAKASWDGADSQPMGSCVWATEPYQPQACQATVISRDGKSVFKIGIRENTQDPQALWEFKSPALEIANLWSLLSEGKTVTFNHPFLTVQGNAVLGMVGPYSGKHSDIKDAKGVVKFKVSPTFLHWEVFSAQADSTVTSLVNLLVEKSGGALSEDFFPTILSATPEEAFADESISSKFGIKGALAGWADFPTKPVPYDLVKKYNDQASTGTKVDLGFDLGKMIPPSKLSPPQTEVIWKIEWVHSLDKGEVVLPPSYRIHLTDTEAWVDFTDSGDEGKFDKPPSRVALTSAHWSGKTLVNLVLCAPLLADLVRIDGEASSLTAASSAKEIGAVDFARFKALTGTSFRSTRLKFTSNWLPTSNQILLNSEAGKGIPPAALTWWDPAQESPGLNAASGADAKLFGSALPSDGTVETMNPITLKWILEMLSAMKDTLTFKQPSPDTKPDGKPSRGALKPVGAGILSKEATVAFGTELVLIVVDEMYALGNEGSTPATYELRLKFIPSPSSPSASATASASSGLQAAAQGGSIPTADSLKTTGIGMAKSEMTNAFGKAKQELTGSPLREGVMPVEFVDHLHVPVAVDDCGIFFDRRMADVWGECTLEVFSDEELMKTSPWGLAKINIDPPRFSEATASPEDHLPFPKTRCLGWVVPWSAPEIRSKFAGLVEVVILGGNGARTPTGFCVRAIAQPKESPSASFKTENQVKFDGEFVVGFTPGKTNGKLLTKDISWDSVKAAATTPRVHQALVLSLQDLFTHLGKPVKLSAIESDGLGCLMDGDCTVAATTTNLFSMIQLVDTRTRLRVVPANSHQLLFEFDPLPAILEAYDEDPKKVLDKDYSFDFHVVAGMSERIDALKEVKVFKLDQSRSPASIATYPCPEHLGHYGALGFGELQARLYAPSTATPSASQWHFELELAGNTDLWSRQILEATISFGVITGIPETQSVQTVGTVESGKVVFVAFQPAEGDFLRKGKHVLKVRARPRTEADGEKSPSGAIKEFSDSLLGPLVGTELECSRSIDLTAKLGAATTTRSAQGVQVAISTQGLLETLLPKEMASTEVDAFHCQFVAANGRTAPLPGPHSDGRTYPARDGNLHVQVPQVLLAAWGDGRVEVRGQNASHAGASFLSAQVPVGAASQGGAA